MILEQYDIRRDRGDIFIRRENSMWRKFLSRKFLVAVGAVVLEITVGLGYNVDPEVVFGVAGAIAALYIAVEGAIDSFQGRG